MLPGALRRERSFKPKRSPVGELRCKVKGGPGSQPPKCVYCDVAGLRYQRLNDIEIRQQAATVDS